MIEIVVIVLVSIKIAFMMKEKGRNAAGYIVLFIGLWAGGEIIGAVAGVLFEASQNPGGLDSGVSFVILIFALIGAAIGGTIGYVIAHSMPPLEVVRRRDYDDYGNDFDHEPRRRRSLPDEHIQDRPDRARDWDSRD